MSGGTAFFSLVQTFRQRMRQWFANVFFVPAIDISVDFIGIIVTEEPCVSGLVLDGGEIVRRRSKGLIGNVQNGG